MRFRIKSQLSSKGLIEIPVIVAFPASTMPYVIASNSSLVVQATSANCVSRGSDDGLYTITGEVLNDGFTPATQVQVIGTFYGESGQLLVNQTSQLTDPPQIAPGLSASFTLVVICPGCALVASYRLEATNSTNA